MIITAIRWRAEAEGEPTAFKLHPGTGKFRNYQCLVADPATLRQAAAAIDYTLSGASSGLLEASLQLADDAGHTWLVHRKPGLTRYLKDGQVLSAGEGERAFRAALNDLDWETIGQEVGGDLTVKCHSIRQVQGELRLCAMGTPEAAGQSLKDVVMRQIGDIAADCARQLGIVELAEPRLLTRLVRTLEPLSAQYRELCRQYKEIKNTEEKFSDSELTTLQSLADEIQILEQLAEVAEPLLQPGVSPRGYKEDLAKLEGQIAEICNALGIETPDPARLSRDFRKPLEALCRLEAYSKLVRASQGTRKYCEQNIEPLYKKYFEIAEGGLIKDRQIAAELESCLATLTLKLRGGSGDERQKAQAAESGIKTWFDRFKSREKEDAHDLARATEEAQNADIETARMAIEYALSRLSEIGGGIETARANHDGALKLIDDAHEELVKNYGRLRDHWLQVAKEHHLPEDMDVTQLLRVIAHYGRLATLIDRREGIAEMLRKHGARMTKAERLILEWRKVTGSQKEVDLGNPTLLLTEARDVLRYRDAKKKKFDQLTEQATEVKANLALRGLMKGRRKLLMDAWQKAFDDLQVKAVEIHHEALDEVFQKGAIVRALALVHGSAGKIGKAQLFEESQEAPAASLFVWEDKAIDNKLRLAFLNALEEAQGAEPRLLLLADEGLAGMLKSLGIGAGSRIVRVDAPKPEPQAQPIAPPVQAKPSPVIPRTVGVRPQQQVSRPAQPAAPALNERAQRTLDLLAGRKPS